MQPIRFGVRHQDSVYNRPEGNSAVALPDRPELIPQGVGVKPPVGPPRIALVYGDYPPNLPGRADGGSDFLRRLAEGLVAHGHDVTAIVSSRHDRPAPFVSEAGVRVAPVIRQWTLRGAIGGQLSTLRRELKANRIDIVHLIYPDPYLRYRTDSYHLPFLIKATWRRPLVVTFFGFGVTGASLVTKAGLLSLFATADRVVITDADLLRTFRRRLSWWSGKSRGGLVGSISADDAPAWSSKDLLSRKLALGLHPEQRHVGFFGFWSPDKGLDNLLEAVRRLRQGGQNVMLVLIGGRAPSERLESERAITRLAETLGIAHSVIDTGPLSAADVSRYMVAMDVCALPFKVNPLGRSSLALALQLGVPTTVTRPPEEDAALLSGLALLDPPDPDQIADSIAGLLAEPAAQQANASAASRAAKHWSWDSIVAEYASLYGELVGGHRGR